MNVPTRLAEKLFAPRKLPVSENVLLHAPEMVALAVKLSEPSIEPVSVPGWALPMNRKVMLGSLSWMVMVEKFTSTLPPPQV